MVAKVNNSRAVVLELIVRHLRDVRELGHLLASCLEIHVGSDIET